MAAPVGTDAVTATGVDRDQLGPVLIHASIRPTNWFPTNCPRVISTPTNIKEIDRTSGNNSTANCAGSAKSPMRVQVELPDDEAQRLIRLGVLYRILIPLIRVVWAVLSSSRLLWSGCSPFRSRFRLLRRRRHHSSDGPHRPGRSRGCYLRRVTGAGLAVSGSRQACPVAWCDDRPEREYVVSRR